MAIPSQTAPARASLYARVSTPLSKTRTDTAGDVRPEQDPEVQLVPLRDFATRRGWVVQEEFIERASGSASTRPVWERMLLSARRREFDVVVVAKLDRAARSVSHLVRSMETFRALGIDFVSMSEQWDTSTPQGKLIFHILAAVAEFEGGLISDRTKAGIALARQRRPDLRWGRKAKRVDLAEVQRLVAEGMPKTEIARVVGVGRTTLYKLLSEAAGNPV